jgi:hypothetical protein
MDPESNCIFLEQLAHTRDQVMWKALRAPALAPLHWRVIQSTSDAAPGRLADVEHYWETPHSPDLFHVLHELVKAVCGPMATNERAAHKARTEAREPLRIGNLNGLLASPRRPPPPLPPAPPPPGRGRVTRRAAPASAACSPAARGGARSGQAPLLAGSHSQPRAERPKAGPGIFSIRSRPDPGKRPGHIHCKLVRRRVLAGVVTLGAVVAQVCQIIHVRFAEIKPALHGGENRAVAFRDKTAFDLPMLA